MFGGIYPERLLIEFIKLPTSPFMVLPLGISYNSVMPEWQREPFFIQHPEAGMLRTYNQKKKERKG